MAFVASCTPPEVVETDTATSDAGPDTPVPDVPRPDAPITCGSLGTLGGHCRVDACGDGDCQPEILRAGVPLSLRTAFGFEQAGALDVATGFYLAVPPAMADPARDVPLPIASGSLCTTRCDARTPAAGCGSCATCVDEVGTRGVLGTALLDMTPAFGDDTGWCRADCTFDAATAGAACPAPGTDGRGGHTCSPASNVCVEGCISDNECRFSIATTREGLAVAVVDDSIAATCDPVTRRCEWTRADATSVGDPCERSSDCAEDVGVCLNGGTCAEYECARAADTTADMRCDGGAGVCLNNGGNGASICVAGCTEPDDCNPGNTCIPFDGGTTAGPFTGYCVGICDARLDDPDGAGPLTTADDELWACPTGSSCDDPGPSPDDLDPVGRCRPTCTVDADCTTATPDDGDHCEIVAGSSPAYGFCRWTSQVCDHLDLSNDCYAGQVCDLLAWPENLGLCVDACSVDGDCDTGETCITAGGRNVCRTACVTGGTPCGAGMACQMGLCEQLTTT